MWTTVLFAGGIVGALGLVFGGILAVASRVFAVQEDLRLGRIAEFLPGANCGACGHAGCQAYAQALVNGKAEPDECPVGGEAVAKDIAAIMGIELTKNTRMSAFVRCSGGTHATKKYDYIGINDCHAAMKLGGGPTECEFGCLGLGSCVSSCRFGAISMIDGVAVVDHNLCTGCLKCIKTCPKHIIHLVPYYADVNIACSSHNRGAALRSVCNIGCLGCHICEKVCPHDAITVTDNLAEIDFVKCTGCGECATRCPRGLIHDAHLDRSPLTVAKSS